MRTKAREILFKELENSGYEWVLFNEENGLAMHRKSIAELLIKQTVWCYVPFGITKHRTINLQ